MPLPTAPTYPAVKAGLVAVLQARDGLNGSVQVSYAWLGPATKAEGGSICLDPPGEVLRGSLDIASMKSGRKSRNDVYDILVLIQYADATIGAEGAQTVDARCSELFGAVDGALADDPQLGMQGGALSAGWAEAGATQRTMVPEGKGWLAQVLLTVEVHSRLA